MKTLNALTVIIGFLLIGFLPFSVIAGSFLYFVTGCSGFIIMMNGLLKNVK